MRKYVLTGGPCCGKSSVIEYLSGLGYPVIEESARHILEKTENKPQTREEWLQLEEKILQEQLLRESSIEQTNDITQIFLDRGVPDVFTYMQLFCQYRPNQEMYHAKGTYAGIFLLDRIPFVKDDVRLEKSDEDSALIHEHLRNTYETLGYKVISIPLFSGSVKDSIRQRAEYILKTICEV